MQCCLMKYFGFFNVNGSVTSNVPDSISMTICKFGSYFLLLYNSQFTSFFPGIYFWSRQRWWLQFLWGHPGWSKSQCWNHLQSPLWKRRHFTSYSRGEKPAWFPQISVKKRCWCESAQLQKEYLSPNGSSSRIVFMPPCFAPYWSSWSQCCHAKWRDNSSPFGQEMLKISFQLHDLCTMPGSSFKDSRSRCGPKVKFKAEHTYWKAYARTSLRWTGKL